MKKAVILHGTDGSPSENWFSWLKGELEKDGFRVFLPELPNNHTPNRKVYNDFLIASGWDFANNLVIGHSSGAVSILNMLSDNRFPRIKTAVLVGAWAHMKDTDLDRDQFKDLFPAPNFDFAIIKQKAERFIFIHSVDDPYCPIDQARYLCDELGGTFYQFEGMKHFSTGLDERFKVFPGLLDIIKKENV